MTLLIATAAVALVVAIALDGQRQRRALATGAELFDGRRPLPARIHGHDEPLPPTAARCTNCHGGGTTTNVNGAAGAASAALFGPPLTAATLATSQARRGGPPSVYDAAALCRLLRTGVDPAFVQIPRAMPRYEIDDAGCAALWAWMAQR
jgi:hypothetical protein